MSVVIPHMMWVAAVMQKSHSSSEESPLAACSTRSPKELEKSTASLRHWSKLCTGAVIRSRAFSMLIASTTAWQTTFVVKGLYSLPQSCAVRDELIGLDAELAAGGGCALQHQSRVLSRIFAFQIAIY